MEQLRTLPLALGIAFATGLLGSSPAGATITCNRDGDCWHTEKQVSYPNITLVYHDDSWWDAHGTDHDYKWHEADAGHDWRHGYWLGGKWHRSTGG